MAMGENSAECSTLIDLTSELRLAVRSQLVSLTGSLLATRLISLDNDIELRNVAYSEVERSARLVELVQNKVRQNPRHYHSFIGILQGNQDQYRDILQRLEQIYQAHKQEDGAQGVDADVLSHVHDLERQFRQLHENLLTDLEVKKVTIEKLLHSLTLLPTEIREEYKRAISEIFEDLRRETTISDIFYHLSPLVDFLSYGLLEYVINEFGSNSLKKDILSYRNNVLVFMKNTTLKQLMNVWPGQQEIPPNFSTLRANIDKDPSTYTLYELDQVRRRFCSGVKLTDIVLVLIRLETANSFTAEWLIPSALIPKLMESTREVDDELYLQEHILKMTVTVVDEEQIFFISTDSKPKLPAFPDKPITVKMFEMDIQNQLKYHFGRLIHLTIKHGSLEDIEFLLNLPGAMQAINCTDDSESNKTPLVIATENDDLGCVKLLLSHGAQLTEHVQQIANEAGHKPVATYIQQCIKDTQKLGMTRAQMIRKLYSIVANPKSSSVELKQFSADLNKMIEFCDYDINLSHDDEIEPLPLLIRASHTDNVQVVLKLLNTFKADPLISDPRTGENLLHITCKIKSKLRFFFARMYYQHLFRTRDKNEILPLHVACSENDIDFISWLFKNILAEESAMDKIESPSALSRLRTVSLAHDSHPSSSAQVMVFPHKFPPSPPIHRVQMSFTQAYTNDQENGKKFPSDAHEGSPSLRRSTILVGSGKSTTSSLSTVKSSDQRLDSPAKVQISCTDIELNTEFEPLADEHHLNLDVILKESPLKIADIIEMKLLSRTENGDSVFHILARKGHSNLLKLMLKVAEFVQGRLDLKYLVYRDSQNKRLPIEEAIDAKNGDCIQSILHFLSMANLLPKLANDPLLLQKAVFTGAMDVVNALIEYGFHKGLSPAIATAVLFNYSAILRVLLYYQTQVVNALEFSHLQYNSRKLLLKGGSIKWGGFQLEEINPMWFHDASYAFSSVSKVPENAYHLFQLLSRDCLHYFSKIVKSTASPESGHILHGHHIAMGRITEVDLSSNKLRNVPIELFQLSSLVTLQLSHNKLTSLPSSEKPWEMLYTAHIARLNLNWNNLKTLPEGLFRDLSASLMELNVEHNHLQELPPGLWVIPKLKVLKLASNNLSRLHYLSSPKYFSDPDLSRIVNNSFTSHQGTLKCTEPVKDKELEDIEDYLIKLGDYHYTVCTTKLSACEFNENMMDEIMGIHVSRMKFYDKCEGDHSSVTVQGQTFNIDEVDKSSLFLANNLETIDLSNNNFTEIPWDLPCIAPQLKKLFMQKNQIQKLDVVHSMPHEINSVKLVKNKIDDLRRQRPMSLPCGHPLRLLTLPAQKKRNMYCIHCKHISLEHLTHLSIDSNQLILFPVELDSFPMYPNLTVLSLEANNLQEFPANLHELTHLTSVNLSHNKFNEIPPKAGLINAQTLFILKMDGMYIKNIPPHLLRKPSPKALLNYLKALLHNSRPYRHITLMTVGDSKKGKTSLLLNLVKNKKNSLRSNRTSSGSSENPEIDLQYWEYAPPKENKITFRIWDFGGKEELYAIHQCFLTKRSLYLLVWNIQDGEDGIRNLNSWLENIEGYAPKSPVIIVGTHLDTIARLRRKTETSRFNKLIRELYVDSSHSHYRYPAIQKSFFISKGHVDELREYIYKVASLHKPPAPDRFLGSTDPYVQQLIPASYIKLQEIVSSIAQKCKVEQSSVPIYNKDPFRSAVIEAGYSENLDEFDQTVNFLHENRILLHFEDNNLLSEIYFVDPQWLCSILAKVESGSIQHNNGCMEMENLTQKLPAPYVKEFISLMQKFEIILLLDEKHLLIPSLLPTTEEQACCISFMQISDELHDYVALYQTPYPILARYYLMPFVPNGFFARVIARLMSTDIINHLQQSLADYSDVNNIHWRCWKDGVIITWSDKEIFHIAPITLSLRENADIILISSEKYNSVELYNGVEINIAILPEEWMKTCSIFPKEYPCLTHKGKCLAAWLLHQATTIINSVFEDWYEVFVRHKGRDCIISHAANPCPECFKTMYEESHSLALITPIHQGKHNTLASVSVRTKRLQSIMTEPDSDPSNTRIYLFSSPYCARAVSEGLTLKCPTHGELSVTDIAPDIVFCDFPPSLVLVNSDPEYLVVKEKLGSGSFGSVSIGRLDLSAMNTCTAVDNELDIIDVAVKEFHENITAGGQDPGIQAEINAWDIYLKASLEARIMVQLQHPHVLSLIGLTLQPLRLIVELAPLGDLKSCIKKFSNSSVRLARKTIKTTLLQVAEAMDYLHSRNFVYRDLKPGNVLVFKYPEPDTQWDYDSSIWLKVADYGISMQVSPQGLLGVEGTHPYLPPEVILHCGREAYSTKIDVYAFGMFIYYLVTFQSPFEKENGPITNLLQKGGRPEIQAKLHPQSLQLHDLMCWCWSDKPQYRPTFNEILNIIKTDTFTHLLEATPISKDLNDVTAACITSSVSRAHSLSTSMEGSMSVIPKSTYSTALQQLLLAGENSSSKGDVSVQVWYGTKEGECGIVNFHKSITNHNLDLSPRKQTCIITVKVIHEYVWICTENGVHVYDVGIQKSCALWELESEHVHTLLHANYTNSILVLATRNIYVFDDKLVHDVLKPRHSIGIGNKTNGAVIPAAGNLQVTEIWVCNQTQCGFSILDSQEFHILDEVHSHELVDKPRQVQHIQPVCINERSYVMVSNLHFIEQWDVELREKIHVVDVMMLCKEYYGDQALKCQITSMIGNGDILYVGTKGGVLLALDCLAISKKQPSPQVYAFHAYTGAVCSLIIASPSKLPTAMTKKLSHSNISSRKKFSNDDSSHQSASQKQALRFRKRSSTDSNISHAMQSAQADYRSLSSLDSERSMLISFGIGYSGVVGNSGNSPKVFILPSDRKRILTQPAKPNPNDVYLLLWSIEREYCDSSAATST